MVFSSHIFLFYFLPVTLLFYYLIPRRGKHITLTLLSYLFYGWANPYFVFLMFASTFVDYICGLVISQQFSRNLPKPIETLKPGTPRLRIQKIALAVSILSNLSLLGFFKYFNFGVDNYNSLMAIIGLGHLQWVTFFRITLPLGISFYTFQSMSYSIDVYRGEARAIGNFIDFSCYVAMFPQLVAGPIVRFHEVADQLVKRTFTMEKFARGVSFMCCGLAKKILLANACGKIADVCFHAGGLNPLDAWYGMASYSFQIYFDFSGYSDMAIGLGLMLGFVFPKNFDSPYLSQSISDFWRRWHLSLSNWLRDYLYIPLGGNRKGKARTYVNLAMVMLLGGLWHGSSWNFIIWGGIHGCMLAIERTQGKDSFYRQLPKVVRIALTFLIISFTWIFFRAPTLRAAFSYLRYMFGIGSVQEGAGLVSGLIYQPYFLISFIMAALFTWGLPQTWDFTRTISWKKAVWCTIILLISIAVMTTQAFNPFIYFMF